MYSTTKRILVGKPIASAEEHHHRLNKIVALPVFASDAISSTAYATDAILVVLLIQAGIGAEAWKYLVPIAVIVCILLVIVVLSYRQTIFAYPSGGGSYIVSRENLGVTPSLVAGSALLVDYVLTVAVSVAGGVLAIRSAAGFSNGWTVPVCLVCIALMTLANLRGVKESGALFAGPTYFYVVLVSTLIVVGLIRIYFFDLGPIPNLTVEGQALAHMNQSLSFLMLLRAFSSGAVALSGVEAVSNGVPAFRRPESRNAAKTLMSMAIILGTTFLGVSILAAHLKPYRGEEGPTGIALMAAWIYDGKGVMFWLTQIATFAILILAANTAYADFPRLSSIISRDGFLPRQFSNRGDRLVFSNGILFLALAAGVLIVIFKGNISALIPLYAFGVFTGFTLSQAGMVVHHFRLREPRWRPSAVINGIGAVTTGIVALVVVVSKFTEGAWIPAALIPIMVLGLPHDRPALPARPPGGPRRSRLPRPTPHPLRGGARRLGEQGRAERHQLRPIARPRPAHRRVGRRGRRGAGGGDEVVGRAQHPDRAAHDLLALPRAHPPDPELPRRARPGVARTTSSRWSSPSS